MFAFVSTVTTVSNDPVSNGGSILVVIINFSTPCPPLAKRGSLTHSQALALSKRARDVTAPPVALNRCALRLAGHQSPRQGCFSGDEPARVNTYKMVVRDGTALLKAGHQRSRQDCFSGCINFLKTYLFVIFF